jgi:hypothetical protein
LDIFKLLHEFGRKWMKKRRVQAATVNQASTLPVSPTADVLLVVSRAWTHGRPRFESAQLLEGHSSLALTYKAQSRPPFFFFFLSSRPSTFAPPAHATATKPPQAELSATPWRTS